ncbi:MAG: hypothetical protein NTW86_13185 [Candidatus Sumerlaeota bacterium]|nr:hypothetical protein [Candidatus Sumerlaeota bacterium]
MNRRTFIQACGATLAATRGTFAIGSETSPYKDNIKRLVDWLTGGFVGDDVNLVPDLPSGKTFGGTERDDLKRLFWLQNCNLFAFHALRPHAPEAAKKIEDSYWRWYRGEFSGVEERTEHYLALGKLPAQPAPEGKYYRVAVKKIEHDGATIGTETFEPGQYGAISDKDPRGLLKFGALGACLRGDKKQAQGYFQRALKLWDGAGFTTTKMEQHNAYYARYLAYALIAERALHAKIPPDIRDEIERRLWAIQDKDGGIWTNYYKDGSFPGMAKKTTESGPLTLLAYNEEIWP